nr:MAG TPA: restriction alleviation protein [Caudoviricetes sp.]
MVKCGNPDCAVPVEGYPSGRNLIAVREQWNRRANDKEDEK